MINWFVSSYRTEKSENSLDKEIGNSKGENVNYRTEENIRQTKGETQSQRELYFKNFQGGKK